MPRNVLVAVDDSPLGREALAYALDAFPDARVVAAHVAFLEFDMLPSDTPEVDAVGLDELDGVGDETAQRVFEAIRDVVGERSGVDGDLGSVDGERENSEDGRTVAVSFLTGEPGDRLVEYVEAGGFDHVVLGTHGRDGVSRLLIGSVAEDVVRRTDVPTTLVK
ncbi:universal stress protein [Halorubrum sp. JWXQ-INN 858]|uniref:universal stress protein n=1 Tax=Halorubrum sp. JWXQ-INN 858 TaxID=2690782 RepID=UPI00135AFAB9|nr:universal stress protein [Halorubrum sp. JWXQ-INN 858]MWV64578.1 universal stress protein [Halorubrum sp. JWXQ-INN 858]